MVVEMAVTGTVVQIEHRVNMYEIHQADMLLICELEFGGEGPRATSEGPERMTLGVLGARVRVVDDWGLPGLREVKDGDLVYASGGWHAPGSHDLEQEMRFVETGRDWYRLESWDAGDAGKLQVRAVEISADSLWRYVLREARWERLTEEISDMPDPIYDAAGWNIHRSVHQMMAGVKAEEAVAALDTEAEIGWRKMNLRVEKEFKQRKRSARRAEHEAMKELAQLPEVEAQKEAARKLAARGRKGKRGKRKRRS